MKTAILSASLVLLSSVALAQGPAVSITQAVESYNGGNFQRAALQFYEVKQTDGNAANRAQAEYYLGQSLFRLGMYQSALAYFNAAFVAGPAHPYYLKGAEGLIKVAEALRDDTLIPSQINKYYNAQEFAGMDPMALSRINFYVGLLLYRQEKYGESMAFLGAVDENSPVFAKALFLQGVIHIRLGVRAAAARAEAGSQREYEQAIALFERIIDLSGRQKQKALAAIARYDNIVRIWQLCTLNLARAYYGKGDYQKAVQFYERIPRFSQDWADALFEVGWAHFMRKDFGKALGALHTLHSPHFGEMFVPESWMLKATIYFHVCLYEEAEENLKFFDETYAKMIPVLRELTEKGLPNEAFSSLLLKDKLDEADPMSRVPAMVRRYILENPRVENFRHFLRSLDTEGRAIAEASEWKGSRLAEELAGIVTVQRNLLEKTAGGFVKANLVSVAQTIQGFSNHAKLIALEITPAKRELVKAGVSIKAEERGRLAPRPRVVDETYNYWPFRGEYWEDELGYYEYTVRQACLKTEK
jgi:tetratricopeptide (TPR) repeat protein